MPERAGLSHAIFPRETDVAYRQTDRQTSERCLTRTLRYGQRKDNTKEESTLHRSAECTQ